MKSISLTRTVLVAFVFLFSLALASNSAPTANAGPALQSAGPRRGRFRVSLLGFTVRRETWDDALERDGKRDEVYVVAQSLVFGADGRMRSDSGILRSRVMGDPTGRPERIAAGSTPANSGFLGIGASAAGGLRTGDRFPTNFGGPGSALHRDALPMLLWEGELVGISPTPVAETNLALVTLSLWEWDTPGQDSEPAPPPVISANDVNYFLSRTRVLPDFFSLPLPPPLLCGKDPCKTAPPTPQPAPVLPAFNPRSLNVQDHDAWTVTLLNGGIGSNVRVGKDLAGDPRNRPIGMTDAGDHYEFRPLAFVLPYYIATGGGLVELRYQDDERLKGDYILTVLIEELH